MPKKFLAGSGHTVDEWQKLANANQPLPHFPLAGTVRAKAAIERGTLAAPNVVAIFPGSDAKLKKEYVVMSAHLDHLGIGRAADGDAIYNGAMDDASGIASILEIAPDPERVRRQRLAKRSLIFLAVTGEEKGELGSRYFAARPTVPAKQIVADINLDMFMPLHALKVIEVQGLGESTLGETIRAAAAEAGVAVQADKEPEQNRFIRSDQYSFIRNGVPALAFKFGYEFGTPEEKIHKDWLRDRYHKPSDDLNQPVDKEAAAQFDRIIVSLLTRVAGMRIGERFRMECRQLLQAIRERRPSQQPQPGIVAIVSYRPASSRTHSHCSGRLMFHRYQRMMESAQTSPAPNSHRAARACDGADRPASSLQRRPSCTASGRWSH